MDTPATEAQAPLSKNAEKRKRKLERKAEYKRRKAKEATVATKSSDVASDDGAAAGTSREAPPQLAYTGDAALSEKLGEALLTQWRGNGKRGNGQTYTHGFHPYKALMEPLCVAQLLELLPGQGAIYDPFAGSGTTMVECALAGRAGLGGDISPLAAGVAKYHAWRPSEEQLGELKRVVSVVVAELEAAVAGAVAAVAAETREGGAASVVKEAREAKAFAVEFELARQVVSAAVQQPDCSSEVAGALWFLLSHEEVYVWPEWRTQRPLSWRLDRTALRYAEAIATLVDAVPSGTPAADVRVADARTTRRSGLGGDGTVPFDGVLTSPPYPGVYDYLEFTPSTSGLAAHMAREWRDGRAAAGQEREEGDAVRWEEIGSKGERQEHEADPSAFVERWQTDTAAWLEVAASSCRAEGGRIAMLIGDDSGVNCLESIRQVSSSPSKADLPTQTLPPPAS
mmetsp:Transcript_2051/g.4376  ORF Transcript_2051/g.4376 Transcript_2051/m.4376 type:complete len:455 (-) Transcript_2051:243-1607(-)